MKNWSILKAAIAKSIKNNSNQEITGQVLQNVLNSIVSSVGENSTFVGIATPTTSPGAPDGPVFYLATEAGVYANFNSIEITSGEVAILEWKGSWTKKTTGLATLKQLSDLENKSATKENLSSYKSALIHDDTSLYKYLKFVDGIKFELSTRRYVNDENYFYIEIEKKIVPI